MYCCTKLAAIPHDIILREYNPLVEQWGENILHVNPAVTRAVVGTPDIISPVAMHFVQT